MITFTKKIKMGEVKRWATSDNREVLQGEIIGFGKTINESVINYYQAAENKDEEVK